MDIDINDIILWFVNPPREVGVCGVPPRYELVRIQG